MTDNPRIVIIGAGGFIGHAVVNAFDSAGYEVIGINRSEPVSSPESVKWVIGDGHDWDVVSDQIQDHTMVIYLGGDIRPGSGVMPQSTHIKRDLKPVLKLAEHLSEYNDCQLIFTSSGGTVYGKAVELPIPEQHNTAPLSAYGVTKLAAENYLRILARNYGIRIKVLRISNPYGPGQVVKKAQGFIAAAMRAAYGGTGLTIWGDGQIVRDYVYITDVAKAYLRTLNCKSDYNIFNVGYGQGYSLNQIVTLVETATGCDIDVTYETGRPVDVEKNVLLIDKAKIGMGWEPEHSIEDGLKLTANWWAQQF